MELVDAPNRRRSQSVAVVAASQADERRAPSVLPAALLPVLKRHLQRDLGGARARVRVEDALEPGRSELREARREHRRAAVGEAERRRMGHPLELLAYRLIDQ